MGDRELLTAREVQQLLAIGRSKAYDMIAKGELPTLRIGRIVRVPRRDLFRWIQEHTVSGGGRAA